MNKPILIEYVKQNKGERRKGKYKCSCGFEYITTVYDVEHGKSRSCGCVRRKGGNKKHGESKTRFYYVWSSMRRRCQPGHADSKYYYDRGIRVCKRWEDYTLFKKDMFPSYTKGMTLDRVDNNGHYCKKNCRWVGWETQQNNKTNSRSVRIKGIDYPLARVARENEIAYTTLYFRLYKSEKIAWSTEKAIVTKPLKTSERQLYYSEPPSE